MALKLRRNRRLGLVAVLVAVMALAACDTQPATDVTQGAATLNAKGACFAGTTGNWWYQLRNVSRGQGFSDVSPGYSYSCAATTGEVALTSYRVGNLVPGDLYQFRIRATTNGTSYTYDSNGAQGGGNYDSFRTQNINGREDQSSNPPEQGEPCTPTPPNDACAASDNIGKKYNLRNRFYWELFGSTVSDHISFLSWGYNKTTHNIRWIDRNPAPTGTDVRCFTPFGTCSREYAVWRYDDCDRAGWDTCVFRSEGQVNVSFTFHIGSNRYLTSCLGTRINWDGSHVRNAFEGPCPFNNSSAASAASRPVENGALTFGAGENAVKVGRYLTKSDIYRFDRACLGKDAAKAECKKVQSDLFRSLPLHVRARAAGRQVACPALSPDALDSLAPDSSCARRLHGVRSRNE